MKRLFFTLVLLSGFAHAQWDTTNTFKVAQVDGTTVADKVTNAQAMCNADTAINCILIFDPVLIKFPTGTLPSKCTQCTWVDARTPASLFGNATGNQFLIPDGTAALPGLAFAASPTYGFWRNGGTIGFAAAGNTTLLLGGPGFGGQVNVVSGGGFTFTSSATTAQTTADTGLTRISAGLVGVGTGAAGSSAGMIKVKGISPNTNCASAGGTCGNAMTGSVTIAAAATTVTVSVTSVIANTTIFIQEDSTLGTKLGVTCNTVLGRTYTVTTRTSGTSFVITASAAPAANPACLNYILIDGQ